MHGRVHDFIVSQTVKDWKTLPTGHGQGALIPTIVPIEQLEMKQQVFYPKVLEIGSLDINGSQKTYDFLGTNKSWREMIGCEEYIGIDLIKGREVDQVMDAHDLAWKDNYFDLVLCMNMIEHDSDIQQTLREGYRVLKPGGLFLLTTVDETHPEHMEEQAAELNLPYNHITEKALSDMVSNLKPESWKVWHFNSDLLFRIEK